MELLERDEALSVLAAAHASAARGNGAAVFVSGEPGIGKTALVNRFVGELGEAARVLLGACDDLSIPRPLGPLRDLAGFVSPALENAIAAGADLHDIHGLLIEELGRPPRPTVLVLEDVHWADDATLDLITVLVRRIGALPAVLLLTYRDGEVPPGHPLHSAVAAGRPGASLFLQLAPLSRAAVASLAGERADEVFAATRGNPFYVSELLAAPTTDVPPSVAHAVVGRAARLDQPARQLVELVSVVPNRLSTSVLNLVMPGWAAAAEEPERRQLLEVSSRHVRFRHELARNAIRSSIPIAVRRRLHAAILDVLLTTHADPAEVVHHAEAAGAEGVVGEYALLAARRAAALESNREAYSHYRRAADFIEQLAPVEQANVLEELALAAYAADRIADAFPAIEGAVTLYAELGEAAAVGRCTRLLSRFHWFVGQGDLARAKAREAVDLLEPLGESVELARAYSGISQLAMLAEDAEQALAWGERALELARRLGDEPTCAHALVNLGCTKLQLRHDDTADLIEAHAVADAVGDREDATRALGNLAYVLMTWAKPQLARRYARQALAYAEQHEVHAYVSYVTLLLAWLRLRDGDWDEAERVTRRETERGSTVSQILARTILAELAVRRGDPDAAVRLADLAAQAERTREPQRIVPVLELEVESALTLGEPLPLERVRALAGTLSGRFAPRVAAWAAVAGLDVDAGGTPAGPYAAMQRKEWMGAADAFGAIGWTYDRALMLSLLDDESSLVEALETARALGAEPLRKRVTERLGELGLRVPVGPREATRANPAGLTARQLEVASLIAEGLTNAEIAERLVVSPRTAEHHVAAVLTKLGAATRREAARRAAELRLVGRS